MSKMVLRSVLLGALMIFSISTQAQLTLGIIPAENNEQAVARFEPVRQDLEAQLGQSVRVFQATDYTGIVEAMRRGRVDVAWFGPVSGVLAYRQANAVPFAVGVSSSTGVSSYHALILVRADSDLHTLADLEGRNVAFVDPASTSGGLVPSYMVMSQFGKGPEEFFGRFNYAGTHDASVMALVNGSVDGAAVADFLLNNMTERGLVDMNDFRIVATSQPVPGPPMMVRRDLGPELRAQLVEVFTTLHERMDTVIGMGDYSHYEEATIEDYQIIIEMMDMGLL